MTAIPAQVLRPEPLFLGYGFKECQTRPKWAEDLRVREIASVTKCNLPQPGGLTERWGFNSAGYFSSPERATADLAASNDPAPFCLFAYDFYPLRFDPYSNSVAVDPAEVFGEHFDSPPRPAVDTGFEFLGYDAVVRWAEIEPGHANERVLGGGFGCSPLFCNSLSREHPINSHCLIDQWDDAVAAARRFAKDQPEPGCYYIFGVWRSKHR